MRRQFLVLAKLVGLLQLYWALDNFMRIGFTLSMIGRSEPTQIGQIAVSLIGIATYFALSLGMAGLLLARTEWLADKLKMADEPEIEGLDQPSVLLVGVTLIGVYVTVNAIPSLSRVLLDARHVWDGQFGLQLCNKIIPATLQLGLGLFLAMKSEKAVALITKKKESVEQNAAPHPSAPAESSTGAR